MLSHRLVQEVVRSMRVPKSIVIGLPVRDAPAVLELLGLPAMAVPAIINSFINHAL